MGIHIEFDQIVCGYVVLVVIRLINNGIMNPIIISTITIGVSVFFPVFVGVIM